MNESATHAENVRLAAAKITAALGDLRPRIALILGSGLGGLARRVENPVTLAYRDLPGFPVLTVAGHAGQLIVGTLGGVPVIVLNGRKHFYETADAYPLKTMIRAVQAAGVDTLFLSNAAGSLRPSIGVSELMLITDHINFMGLNPLVGPNDEAFGPRFFSVTDAWDPGLRAKIKTVAQETNITLHEGVYVAFRGPSFETPAEIRMVQAWGGDAVGMSSVPDCLIARHCGLKVAGISCITNMGAGLSAENLTHAHTLENAGKGAAAFERLVLAAVKVL
ncbi:Purine nucleoside phosphorylase 1 [Lacunisphaera limnophila]|uniref:Purine nucleoside phosphorylase n=1 Tax=Lacunisphaera limnophila TaxID=1838286 RepID=A0A1D8B000_9BACT|nr:purine-nucleoside phosphorylase [Lacunisphaera limnophila]AOS46471.1 Purine nucleoside phosphorylase 1 [Lacunisphaera limnophila]